MTLRTKPLPDLPLHFCHAEGQTFEEMRANVWKNGLANMGDTVLIWVNQGDLIHLQINGDAREVHANGEIDQT